jgi:hypothetical protein
MKIAIMSPWNTTCGVSVYAELVGREWIRMGHKIVVFAPIESPKMKMTHKDEPFVVRCYTFNREFLGFIEPANYFNPGPLLDFDGDAFIVHNLELMPVFELSKIWNKISGKKILVIHEGSLPMFYDFYSFNWDKIICFDERYANLFSRYLNKGKLTIIPYPCHKLQLGSKEEARKELNLPLNRKIVFSYGLRIIYHFRTLPVLKKLSKDYPLTYLIIPSETIPQNVIKRVKAVYNFIEFRQEPMLTVKKLYKYLHSADALLMYKFSPNIVVSSTIYLCLGSGCPIVVNKGNYTEIHGEEIFKYNDPWELENILRSLFEGKVSVNLNLIKKVLEKASVEKVASMFINVIKS